MTGVLAGSLFSNMATFSVQKPLPFQGIDGFILDGYGYVAEHNGLQSSGGSHVLSEHKRYKCAFYAASWRNFVLFRYNKQFWIKLLAWSQHCLIPRNQRTSDQPEQLRQLLTEPHCCWHQGPLNTEGLFAMNELKKLNYQLRKTISSLTFQTTSGSAPLYFHHRWTTHCPVQVIGDDSIV